MTGASEVEQKPLRTITFHHSTNGTVNTLLTPEAPSLSSPSATIMAKSSAIRGRCEREFRKFI